jgi:hypothetical protein
MVSDLPFKFSPTNHVAFSLAFTDASTSTRYTIGTTKPPSGTVGYGNPSENTGVTSGYIVWSNVIRK